MSASEGFLHPANGRHRVHCPIRCQFKVMYAGAGPFVEVPPFREHGSLCVFAGRGLVIWWRQYGLDKSYMDAGVALRLELAV